MYKKLWKKILDKAKQMDMQKQNRKMGHIETRGNMYSGYF